MTLQRLTGERARATYLMFSLLVLLIALALIGPLLTAYDPEIASPRDSLLAPSAEHWFGTNAYGGDIFSRVVHAARLDLWIGFSTVAAAFVIAAPLGALVGYSRAWWANIIIRVSDFIQSFPIFILAMALVAAAGANVRNLIVVLTLINIPIFLRLVRSEGPWDSRAPIHRGGKVGGEFQATDCDSPCSSKCSRSGYGPGVRSGGICTFTNGRPEFHRRWSGSSDA